MLIANTVTGAASLMRREVVEGALPFPEVPGEQYHDHWLGLVAMSLGEIAYVDRPLYDYVQHGGALLGHAAANAGVTGGGARGAELIERFSSQRIRRYFSRLARRLLPRLRPPRRSSPRSCSRGSAAGWRSAGAARCAASSGPSARRRGSRGSRCVRCGHRPVAMRRSASSGCSPAGSSGATWSPSTAAATCVRPADPHNSSLPPPIERRVAARPRRSRDRPHPAHDRADRALGQRRASPSGSTS